MFLKKKRKEKKKRKKKEKKRVIGLLQAEGVGNNFLDTYGTLAS